MKTVALEHCSFYEGICTQREYSGKIYAARGCSEKRVAGSLVQRRYLSRPAGFMSSHSPGTGKDDEDLKGAAITRTGECGRASDCTGGAVFATPPCISQNMITADPGLR